MVKNNGSGSDDWFSQLVEALQGVGLSLPADTTQDNIVDRLIGMAAVKGGASGNGGTQDVYSRPSDVTSMSLSPQRRAALFFRKHAMQNKAAAVADQVAKAACLPGPNRLGG